MIQIRLNETMRQNVNKRLQFILDKGGDKLITRSLAKSGGVMLRSVDKNFRAQGRPDRWIPLSPATIKLRRKNRGRIAILQDTGRLRGSITMKLGNGSVAIGTNVKYAKFHQQPDNPKGFITLKGKFAGTKLVKRPFLMFQDEDKEMINKIFGDNLYKVITMQEPQ